MNPPDLPTFEVQNEGANSETAEMEDPDYNASEAEFSS